MKNTNKLIKVLIVIQMVLTLGHVVEPLIYAQAQNDKDKVAAAYILVGKRLRTLHA
jgi:hypothetical protein